MRHTISMDTLGYEYPDENEHPQILIKRYFPDARHMLPMSVYSCWLFDAQPRPDAPGYFKALDSDVWRWWLDYAEANENDPTKLLDLVQEFFPQSELATEHSDSGLWFFATLNDSAPSCFTVCG